MNSAFFSKVTPASIGLRLVFGALFIVLCAQISIPLHPVPITLQTAGVIIIGLLYRPMEAAGAMAVYLLAGALGAPVFSGGISDPFTLIGPKGGYLMAFPLAAFLSSLIYNALKEKKFPSWISYGVASLTGTVLMMASGVCWLSTFLGWPQAVVLGLYPFILPGIVKSFFIVGVLSYVTHARR